MPRQGRSAKGRPRKKGTVRKKKSGGKVPGLPLPASGVRTAGMQAGGGFRPDERGGFRPDERSVLDQTNRLLGGIAAMPISTIEELRTCASSMFVFIFETMFQVRLANVIREPHLRSDYITNAGPCAKKAALSYPPVNEGSPPSPHRRPTPSLAYSRALALAWL